jgi:tight adherence protein B
VRVPQYNSYVLSKSERIVALLTGWGLAGITAWVFYKSFWMVLLFLLLGTYYPVYRQRGLLKKKRLQLQLQFKQLMASLSSSLGAGRSVESAFQESLTDLKLLYADPETMMIKELQLILRRLENGETIERALLSFSERAEMDDVRQFADVFVTCKRTGGNLVQVMRRTAAIIQDKLDMSQDIQVALSQKRFESRVLTVAPVLMVAVLGISSPDYLEPMYSGAAGRIIMTVALLVFAGCFALTNKIMDIKV